MWQPSEEFFTHTEVDLTVIKKLFRVISCLCPGLKIVLNDEEYYSKNGLMDLVDEAVKDSEILKNRLAINYTNGKNKLAYIAKILLNACQMLSWLLHTPPRRCGGRKPCRNPQDLQNTNR